MRTRDFFPIVIAVVLVAILLSQIKIMEVLNAVKSISPIWLIFGFVLYATGYFFRALRFHILLNSQISVKDLFGIVTLHNMANNILPARTGELSFIYLVKEKQINAGESIAILMIARFFDFIVISMLFFISVMNLKELPLLISNIFLAISGLLFLVALFLIFLISHREKVGVLIERIVMKLNLDKFNATKIILKKEKEMIESFGIIRSRKVILYTFLTSVILWCFLYLVNYVLIIGMSMSLSIWEVVVGSTFGLFTTILPVQGIGGFGTGEGAWAIAVMSLGISKEIAIVSGFSLHIIHVIYFLVLGGYTFAVTKLR